MAKWSDASGSGSHEPDPLAETSRALNQAIAAQWVAKGWLERRRAQDRLSQALDQHFKAVGEHFSGYPIDDEPEILAGTVDELAPPRYDGPRGRVARWERPEPGRRGAHRRRRSWWQVWRTR